MDIGKIVEKAYWKVLLKSTCIGSIILGVYMGIAFLIQKYTELSDRIDLLNRHFENHLKDN